MSHGFVPLIGITADVSENPKDSQLFIAERYLRAIERAGAIPIVLPATRSKATVARLLRVLNGLVVSGGNFDIHPSYYGEKPIPELGAIKAARTDFELAMTRAAIKRDLPVLGICGGAQAINVVLGGSLFQDIERQCSGARAHERSGRGKTAGHGIRIDTGSRLFAIFGRRDLKVNTSHHQAVKKLGRGLVVNARAGDGVIEGIESTEHRFVIGVQWHPEALALRQKLQRRLFSFFVKICRERTSAR
jgi:putative glutamine amidotransferase